MRRACRWMLGACLLTCLLFALPSTSLAANQGRNGINLGLTSFFDGFGRPVEGFTYQLYLHYARARENYNALGDVNPRFPDPKFDIYLALHQFSYTLPHTLFGGRARPGFNVIIPMLGYDVDFNPKGTVLKANSFGLSDLTFGPTLQFLPVLVNGRPVFSSRLELDLIVPTGKYNPDLGINQGTNYVSFNPYWAFTVLPLPGFELTGRINWIYNFVNERPARGALPPAPPMMGLTPEQMAAAVASRTVESTQAGQTIWLNFATSYEVVKTLHVGASGYYLKQLTRDKFHRPGLPTTNGKEFGEGKQQVLGIGPGLMWEAAKTEKIFANVNFPFLTETRWAWQTYQVRWLHSF